MHLLELLAGLQYKLRGGPQEISGLSYDSRKIKPGDLFIAIKGLQKDGHDYAKDAARRGAIALLVEKTIDDIPVTQVVVENSRRSMGFISAKFYGEPAKKLQLWGVTGTNGKTTTVYLLKSILEAAGLGAGLIGTIQILGGDLAWDAQRTTPESLDLQRILAQMVKEGLDYVVMEVSSHALKLHRTAGLPFSGALFTNLSQDHLDFHQSMQEYFGAKAMLFKNTQGMSAINVDDHWGAKIKGACPGPVITFGLKQGAQLRAEKIALERTGVSYILKSEVAQIPINLKLTGHFNVYNSLGAAALSYGHGIPLPAIKKGLEAVVGVPGRFEKVANEKGYNVIVDYAHTPDGLKNILKTAREITSGRLILVFGAGGDRDTAKRPLMGEIAAKLADYVIITSDNPRSEEPLDICASIEAGVLTGGRGANYAIVADRRQAIQKAIFMAGRQDLVLIAGKGHETSQELATGIVHFDDREEARMAIKELKD